MKLHIENLRAKMVHDVPLNKYETALAKNEFKVLEEYVGDLEKTAKKRVQNVAYGEALVEAIIEKNFDEAVNLIEHGYGDIVEFDFSYEFALEQLFEHIRGAFDFIIVSDENLKIINSKL